MMVSARCPSVGSWEKFSSPARESDPASRYVVPAVVKSDWPTSTCWILLFAQISSPTGQASSNTSSTRNAVSKGRRRRRRGRGGRGASWLGGAGGGADGGAAPG